MFHFNIRNGNATQMEPLMEHRPAKKTKSNQYAGRDTFSPSIHTFSSRNKGTDVHADIQRENRVSREK